MTLDAPPLPPSLFAPLLLALSLFGAPLAIADVPAKALDNDDSVAKEFAASIERLNARDPGSPDTLNIRLAYADFLAKREGSDCAKRLDAAQAQLDLVTGRPSLELLLPSGSAQAASVGYQIHVGRAACNASADTSEKELRLALDAAERAADFYRDGFDAVAMATMQYNVALTYRNLGERDSALSALQSALDMDREYGFADDAADNTRQLLEWSGKPSGASDVAAQLQDFPQRTAAVSFNWAESRVDATQRIDVSVLADNELARVQSSRSARRLVRKHMDSWVVSFEPGEAELDLKPMGSKDLTALETANALARILTGFHDFTLARNGDFDESRGGFYFGARVRADSKLLASRVAALGTAASALAQRLSRAVRTAMQPEVLEAQVAEDYNLNVGTWIGAELEQGVWYRMTAALSLPVGSEVFIQNTIEFAYTRSVPCLPGTAASSCIEIVLRATPDATAVEKVLDKLATSAHLPRSHRPQLWSVTEMRLVIDPNTLQPYRRELRRHTYWWSGAPGPDQSLIESRTSVESLSPPETSAAQH